MLEVKVAAIIILFNPVFEHLYRLIGVLEDEVDEIFVINNGERNWIYEGAKIKLEKNGIKFLEMDKNVGIATALNAGVSAAKAGGYTYCWFFDQDSLPARGSSGLLLRNFYSYHCKAGELAAVVPIVLDKNSERRLPMLVDVGEGIVGEKFLKNRSEVMAAITSGMLINTKAWVLTKGAKEPYFIDFVDTEWCFRARSQGYVILCDPEVIFEHRLGEVRPSWLSPKGRVVRQRSAIRTYYFVRNGLLLAGEEYAPKNWVFYVLKRIIKVALVGLIAGPYRFEQLKAVIEALKFVIKNKSRAL